MRSRQAEIDSKHQVQSPTVTPPSLTQCDTHLTLILRSPRHASRHHFRDVTTADQFPRPRVGRRLQRLGQRAVNRPQRITEREFFSHTCHPRDGEPVTYTTMLTKASLVTAARSNGHSSWHQHCLRPFWPLKLDHFGIHSRSSDTSLKARS